MKPLSSPSLLIEKFPTPAYARIAQSVAQNIFHGTDPRLAVLVGPCSIHDPISAWEFACRLKNLSKKVESTLFPIMRLFIEKPRSRIGWKGMVYDPYLNGTNDIEAGLSLARKLLVEIGHLGLACSMEFLDPLVSFYVSDAISWGVVGARTAASQPHRQMASGFTFPIGFKNDIYGNLEVAIDAVASAQTPHSHIGIDREGRIAALQTKGNPCTHLVLRGSEKKTNYDTQSINLALQLLKDQFTNPKLLIDCSHGNSGKEAKRQKESFSSVIEQISQGNNSIIGLMLESHILGGKQSLSNNPSHLLYGISITDSCLSWEETESLLFWADARLGTVKKALV